MTLQVGLRARVSNDALATFVFGVHGLGAWFGFT